MSSGDGSLAMAQRNTPVRDDLVEHVDDTLRDLMSPEGIPVVKHTRRGQCDNRRLRLDLRASTLEVLRTSTRVLARRASVRTYNLSQLEVRP